MKTRDELDEAITGINVAPLVDVALVLLVIIMLTLSYVAAQAIPMDLPAQGEGAATAAPLRVEIAADGSVSVDGQASSFRGLAERARRFARGTREPHAIVGAKRSDGSPTPAPFAGVGMPSRSGATHVIVAADPEASHGAFVRAVDVLRTAGIRRYTVAVPIN